MATWPFSAASRTTPVHFAASLGAGGAVALASVGSMVHAWHGRHCRSEWRSQCLGVSIAESQPPPRAPALVKPIPVLLVAWVLAGVGAVGGSILGSAAGKP